MIKEIITSVLLCLSIGFTAIGIHINNPIICIIGGFCCGIYNSIVIKKN